jgi:predicted Zn-dependent protease
MAPSHREDLQQALRNLPFDDIEWAGLRRVREITTEREARDGKPLLNRTTDSHGVMAEVLYRGHFGYAATTRTDAESLTQALVAARSQAQHISSHGLFPFTAAARPRVTVHYRSALERPIDSVGAGEINQLLVQMTERLKAFPKMVRAEAGARHVQTEMEYASTHGSDASQTFSIVSIGCDATAQDGNVVQRRTDCGMRGRCYQGGWEQVLGAGLDHGEIWERVERVGVQVGELLAAEECPTGTTSLVLMPDQMMLQIHESIGHPLELDRILGDERNFAGWSFVKLEDFGTLQYGSKLMNVTFDPTPAHELASYAFDDSGEAATREYLIREGKLVRALGGVESQLRAKALGRPVPGVANARATSWNRAPIDRMANLNLEPGTESFDELISSVEDGILMESNRSWSIDDFRNKFQFGCEYARRIQKGKVTSVLRNPNYRGITVPFWKGLKKVGNASTFETYGTPNCGKGEPNQIIRVGHASPVCLFENVEVFGGA